MNPFHCPTSLSLSLSLSLRREFIILVSVSQLQDQPTELQDDYAQLGHTYRFKLYPPFVVKRRKKLTVRNEEERIKKGEICFKHTRIVPSYSLASLVYKLTLSVYCVLLVAM